MWGRWKSWIVEQYVSLAPVSDLTQMIKSGAERKVCLDQKPRNPFGIAERIKDIDIIRMEKTIADLNDRMDAALKQQAELEAIVLEAEANAKPGDGKYVYAQNTKRLHYTLTPSRGAPWDADGPTVKVGLSITTVMLSTIQTNTRCATNAFRLDDCEEPCYACKWTGGVPRNCA